MANIPIQMEFKFSGQRLHGVIWWNGNWSIPHIIAKTSMIYDWMLNLRIQWGFFPFRETKTKKIVWKSVYRFSAPHLEYYRRESNEHATLKIERAINNYHLQNYQIATVSHIHWTRCQLKMKSGLISPKAKQYQQQQQQHLQQQRNALTNRWQNGKKAVCYKRELYDNCRESDKPIKL